MESIQPVLPYKPPRRTEAAYARQAVDVLKVAEHLDVRLLAYLLAPSNVLALAGLRSFSPYNDALPADIDRPKFARLLQSRGFLWIDEQPNIVNPPLASFALINFEAVDGLHYQYPLRVVATNGKILERSGWAFFAWQAGLDIALARTMEQGELPRVWLKDWWSPMHIRFGMLLGYPGRAIETFVDAESQRHSEDLIDVLVAEGRFNSADVAFGVREDERDHEDVVRTVEIWKATLRQVYAVYPEEALMTNADFRRAAEAKR